MQDAVQGHALPEFWTNSAVLIVLLCFALNMVDGIDVLVISYIAPSLQKEWGVTPAELSIVFSAGLAGMAVGGIGLAPLADRFGRRRLILLSLLLMTGAMLASSTAHSVSALAVYRVLVGAGIGTVLACIAAMSARAAPHRHRNFAVGVIQAAYPIGAMLSGFVTAWALPLVGWRDVVLATAAVSAICIPFVLLILPAEEAVAAVPKSSKLSNVMAEERKRSTLLMWLGAICSFMALYFIVSWITKLSIEAGLPERNAIFASAIYNFGAFTGVVGMSLLSTRYDVRTIGSTMLSATCIVFLIFGGVAMPLAGVLITAFIMGITLQGGFNSLYPIAAGVYPDAVRATGIGWVMGVGRIGAFSGPMIAGFALSAKLPLIAVFGIFCVPLIIAAFAIKRVGPQAQAL